MRIVHYHPRALVGDGGVSRSVRRLSAALARQGADAVIAYDARDGAPPVDSSGVEWRPVAHAHVGSAVGVPLAIDDALHDADVLVLNSAWTVHNVRVGIAARRLGIPYVLAHRGAYDPLILRRRPLLKRTWWHAAERRLVTHAAAVHVFFAEQAEDVRALGYHGPVLIAPNGVSVPDGVTWDGGSGGYVLYLGRFDPQHKGLDLLLAAVSTLAEVRRPDVRLHGPDWRGGKAEVEGAVARDGLEPWVTVGPALYGAAKWAAFRSSAAFVYPSRWEGFGNALAEAAVIGVPAVATPYPLARFLEQRGAAIVARPEPEALGHALVRALNTPLPDDRAPSIRSELSWDAVARRWLDQAAAFL